MPWKFTIHRQFCDVHASKKPLKCKQTTRYIAPANHIWKIANCKVLRKGLQQLFEKQRLPLWGGFVAVQSMLDEQHKQCQKCRYSYIPTLSVFRSENAGEHCIICYQSRSKIFSCDILLEMSPNVLLLSSIQGAIQLQGGECANRRSYAQPEAN